MIWLSDCDKPENGPTYVVPGSHRFGKVVDSEFAELHAIPMCGMAGTVVLINNQLWHRGCENISEIHCHTRNSLSYQKFIIIHYK